MRNKFLLLGGVLVIIDQITKLIFSHRDFFLGFIHVHFVANHGLSFALNFGSAVNLILVVGVLVFLGYYFWTKKNSLSDLHKIGLALIFAGAVSNLGDRIVLGYVRDFLDVGLGFTFNLADMFVTFGLVISFLLFD